MRLEQPARGYRYGIDPFLLAAFVRPRPRERIVDLGAGVGVIGLLLAARHPGVRITALEIQPELAGFARRNADASGLAGRCAVVVGDLRCAAQLVPRGSFDRVVANPPYRAPRSGRTSPDPGRARGRTEIDCTLADLAGAAAGLLRPGGSLDLLHAPSRLTETVRTLGSAGLELKELRPVVPFPGAAPRILLLSARLGGRPGLRILPELAVHSTPGRHTPEVAAALAAAGT